MGEGEVGHVRPPPWAIDGEKTETDNGVVVGVGYLLAGLERGGTRIVMLLCT